MKSFQVIRVFHASSSQIEQLEAFLNAKAKSSKSPGCDPIFVDIELEERRPTDFGPFEAYCIHNNLRFWKLRRRMYSQAEIKATDYFLMRDEASAVGSNGTQYTLKTACPICGVGLTQIGPLIIDPQRVPRRKKLFCVALQHSREWILAAEAALLFQRFSGFRLGDVCAGTESGKPLGHLKQVIIENRLPRMAKITNFTEYDPPMDNKCSCNRAGWNLRDEVVYERGALKLAKDFNLTIERWYGGGAAGMNWPIVSQRVRQVMLKNKILSSGCFDPVRIIEQDLGGQYRFDLPLDAPVSAKRCEGI